RRTYITATGFDLYNEQNGSGKAGAIGYFKENKNSARSDENYIRSTLNTKHYVGMGVNRSHNLVIGYDQYTTSLNGYNKAIQVDVDTGLLRLYTPFTAKDSSMEISLETRGDHRGDVGSIGYYSGPEKRQR